MTISKAEKLHREQERADAAAHIRTWMVGRHEKELYGTTMHVRRDGMSRVVKIVYPYRDTKTGRYGIWDASYTIATLLGWRYSETHRGVIVHDAGTDSLHHVVSLVARTVYSSADAIGYRWLP